MTTTAEKTAPAARETGATGPDTVPLPTPEDLVYAKVIAHSVSPEGVEIVTFEKRHHRWVLAEENTHAVVAKNSASSRARPIKKVIDDVRVNPATPLVWSSEQKGMSGGEPISEENAAVARRLWDLHREETIRLGFDLIDLGVHKGITNRLLEPHSMHTSVWTGTALDNYFAQRCHPDAQPEIRLVAERMRDALDASTPVEVGFGEWHLPYVNDEDREQVAKAFAKKVASDPISVAAHDLGIQTVLARISSARVARTSYLTQDGKRDLVLDLGLYGRLAEDRLNAAEPPHWSPLEQVAIPCPANRQIINLTCPGPDGTVIDYPVSHLPKVGKFLGWLSMRHIVEAQHKMATFR